MASRTKLNLLVFLLLIVAYSEQYGVHGESKVPCYFIFGDSLVDSGNNNNLETKAKVNYPPYGIDFPNGPTGRFTNGRTTADVIGELLGFENFIPPFQNIIGSDILKGVNYASGSAGIRQETGKIMGANIELDKQLEDHQIIISQITDMLGNESASNYLKKCLYSFVIGSNDYMNNYYLTQYYNTSSQFTPEKYAEELVKQFSQQIMTLYNSGARIMALTGIGPIGCAPHSVATYDTNGSSCVDHMNKAVQLFNTQLKSLVNQLNNNLTDAKFVYLNTYGNTPKSTASNLGSNVKAKGCCEVNNYGLCIPGETPCLSRNLKFMWDGFHPSEASNKITGGLSYLTLKEIL